MHRANHSATAFPPDLTPSHRCSSRGGRGRRSLPPAEAAPQLCVAPPAPAPGRLPPPRPPRARIPPRRGRGAARLSPRREQGLLSRHDNSHEPPAHRRPSGVPQPPLPPPPARGGPPGRRRRAVRPRRGFGAADAPANPPPPPPTPAPPPPPPP